MSKKAQITIEDWVGNQLFAGHYKNKEVDGVLNANRCDECNGREACDECNGTGYSGDFSVFWTYPELNEGENVYEYINY